MFLALSMGVPTGLAALVHQSQVFFTVILAALVFKEGVRRHHFFAMMIAAVGLFLIGVGQFQGDMAVIGLFVVMAGSFSWALGNIVVKKLGNVNPISLVVWGNLSTFVAFTAGSLCLYGADGVGVQIANLKPLGWLSILYLAYVASLLGYGGWGYLLLRYPASQVTPLALFVPVVALLAGVLFMAEQLTAWHWLGIVVVMASLLIHVFGAKKIRS